MTAGLTGAVDALTDPGSVPASRVRITIQSGSRGQGRAASRVSDRTRRPVVQTSADNPRSDLPSLAGDDGVPSPRQKPVLDRPEAALAKLLVVTPDGPWTQATETGLRAEGYMVRLCAGDRSVDQVGLADLAEAFMIDAAIVDFFSEENAGPAICRELRARIDLPIMAITRRDSEAALLLAEECHADGFCYREVPFRELLARLRSMLRRLPARSPSPPAPISKISAADLQLDLEVRRAGIGDSELALTVPEFEILVALVGRAGGVVSRAQLVSLLATTDREARNLDAHVRRLRDKLEAIEGRRRILTVRGVGFRLEARE